VRQGDPVGLVFSTDRTGEAAQGQRIECFFLDQFPSDSLLPFGDLRFAYAGHASISLEICLPLLEERHRAFHGILRVSCRTLGLRLCAKRGCQIL